MIQPFVDRFMAAEAVIKAEYAVTRPDSYDALVKRVVQAVSAEGHYDDPDPERITVIDHGDWQGTRLYIVGAKGYQPSTYWSIFVNYGSCSGCDAFEAAQGWNDEIPEEEVDDYWAMMLHMVQGMKQIGKDDE